MFPMALLRIYMGLFFFGSAYDKYNGDLSKAGDAIRRAKKYIRKTTGNDSEGALINANYKAYQANVKELQELKGWSRD